MNQKTLVVTFACLLTLPGILPAEGIGAIGYLMPSGGMLDMGGDGDGVIAELLVKSGDHVDQGTLLMRTSRSASLKIMAELKQLEVLQAEQEIVAVVELSAFQEKIALRSLSRAKTDLDAYKNVHKQSIRKQELLQRQRNLQDADSQLKLLKLESQRSLKALRSTLSVMKKDLVLAETHYESSLLRAPVDGRVLSVNKQVGEIAGGAPVLSMASIDQMLVEAEVYEGDLLEISIGMRAEISSASLPEKLLGAVQRIGRTIDRDSRLGKVWILLDDSEVAARFLGMEVQTTILP